MKLPALQTISSVAAAMLLGAAPVCAVEINPTLDLSGYIVGSVRYVDQDGSDTTMDLDATKILTSIKTDPVSGTVSFFAAGTDDVSILDAYFTYDMGGGASVTAGKFLSYHGYEAFDIPNMLQITYSNENLEAIIPGYHKGIKLDVASGDSKMGFAVLDGVYDSDGEIENGTGFEGYYTYSKDALTAYLGAAYDTMDSDGESDGGNSLLLDFWLQYASGATTYAGEVAYKSSDYDFSSDVDSYFISGLMQYEISKGSFVVARVCWGTDDYDDAGSVDFLKGTLAFRQTISDNFTVVEELSYTDFDGGDNKTFLGVQGRFTF